MTRTDRRDVAEPSLLREARAVMFALVGLSLSVALHSWAHGSLPTPAGMLAGAGLMLGLGVLLGSRRRGFAGIAGAVAAAQAGLHAVFSLSAGSTHTLSAGTTHTLTPPHSPGAMLGAHVIAGVLIAVWLYAGEVAVWRVARWLGQRLSGLGALFASVALLVLAPAPDLAPARRAARHVPAPVPPWRRRVVRRGPPLRSA